MNQMGKRLGDNVATLIEEFLSVLPVGTDVVEIVWSGVGGPGWPSIRQTRIVSVKERGNKSLCVQTTSGADSYFPGELFTVDAESGQIEFSGFTTPRRHIYFQIANRDASANVLWTTVLNATNEVVRDRVGLREAQDPNIWLLRLAQAVTDPDEIVRRVRAARAGDSSGYAIGWQDACGSILRHLAGETVVVVPGEPVEVRGALGPPVPADDSTPPLDGQVPPRDLARELASLLNSHCCENESDTPDFVLAEMLLAVLRTWNDTTKRRDHWLGRPCGDGAAIGMGAPATGEPPADTVRMEPRGPITAAMPE